MRQVIIFNIALMKDSKMDRRSFIKRTTFAAAAAAPFFVAKDLFANGSPNEKVNVGIIGIGKQVGFTSAAISA